MCLTDVEIQRLVEDAISPDERARAESHLAECSKCRDLVAARRPSQSSRSHENTATKMLDSKAETIAPHHTPTPHNRPSHDQETLAEAPNIRSSDSTLGGASQPSHTFHQPHTRQMLGLEEFTQNLILSGLMSADELETFRGSFDPEDAQGLADALIRENKLTPYQAEALRGGQTRGLVLGNYVVVDMLGKGGMGMVYKARHRRMKRTVALKVLPPEMTNSPDAISRFHREVEAAAKLTHPNIAAAYDADESDGIHFLVMELVDGPNLSAYIKQAGPLPVAAAVQLMAQAARGLAHAHGQGVVHRDIKPGNLMVGSGSTLKILDMGLAQLKAPTEEEAEELTELTQSGRIMGTVDYMAPEQAIDAKHVDHRADIYSIGCTLFYLLAGRSMSPEGTLTQKLLWHQTDAPPRLSEIRDDIPFLLEEIFQRMVSKSPDDRQPGMVEVVQELDAVLAELPSDGLKDLPLVGAAFDPTAPSTHPALSHQAATLVQRPTRTDLGRGFRSEKQGQSGGRTVWYVSAAAVVLLAAAAGFMFVGGKKETGNNSPSGKTPGNPSQVAAISTDAGRNAEPGANKTSKKPLLYAKILRNVFLHGGSVTLTTTDGKPVKTRNIQSVPDGPYTLHGINLDGTSIQDDDLQILLTIEAKGLKSLSLARTAITDEGLISIRHLSGLQTLDLSQAPVTNKGLAHIVRLAQLHDLNLRKTGVTDQGVAQLVRLKRLEKLYLSDTKTGDTGIAKLKQLKSLRHLALNGTYVTDEGYDALRAALSELDIVWDGRDVERKVAHKLLDKGGIVSLVTRSGQPFQNILRKIDLPRERFHLTMVDLSQNSAVTDQDLALLVGFTKVDTLKLGGTDITADGLKHLHGLQTLKLVDLGTLQLAEIRVLELKKALPKSEIRLKQSTDLAAAQWVLGQKGKITIVSLDGEELNGVEDPALLPKGFFTLREIDLQGNAKISDADIARLKDLAGLESLYLGGTGITDTGLAQLGGLTSLRNLNVSGTKVPSSAMAKIARFKSLLGLFLADTSVDGEGLKHLRNLRKLTHLSLSRTKLNDSDLIHLKHCPELAWLSLADAPFTDACLEHLVQLRQLSELLVNGTKITDAAVEQLKAELPKCKIQHDPLDPQRLAARWILQQRGAVALDGGEFIRLNQLPRDACLVSKIDLAGLTSLQGSEVAKVLRDCKNLQELKLNETTVGDEILAALADAQDLAHLHLSGTRVSDAGLARLAGAKKLRTLDLRGTRVRDDAFARLSGLASLENLYLGQTSLSNTALGYLKVFSQLTSLDLSNNRRITDGGFTELADLRKLQVISLRGTGVTDKVMDQLAGYKQLKQLDLSNTRLTDTGAAKLKELTQLQTLNLSRTKISQSSLGVLGKLKTLRRLSITGVKLSKESLDSLKKALPKCTITASSTRREEDRDSNFGGDRSQGLGGRLRE